MSRLWFLVSFLAIILAIGIFSVGCETQTPTVDKQQSILQEQMLKDQNAQVGLPNIVNWTQKKDAKRIAELNDDPKLITYAYTQNLNGKYVFIGQCMGYGLPYSVQYTNPERVELHQGTSNGGNVTVPQADPNGLFMPDGLSATWIQYINPDNGKIEVIYCEPNVLVSKSKLPKRLVEEWSMPSNY